MCVETRAIDEFLDAEGKPESLRLIEVLATVVEARDVSYVHEVSRGTLLTSVTPVNMNQPVLQLVVVVLSQRYGPRLGAAGYPDISATHLEYREAKTKRKPIYFYVRDRLEADYVIWRNNKPKASLRLPWVKDKRDYGLFELMEEHRL